MSKKAFDGRLKVYMRSEKAILDIYIRNKLRTLFYTSLAFICILTALVMLDIGVFFTLTTYFTTKNTAFILAGSNLVLFILLICFARRKRYQRELQSLEAIRDVVKEDIEEEVFEVTQGLRQVTDHISSLFSIAGLAPILKKVIQTSKSKS